MLTETNAHWEPRLAPGRRSEERKGARSGTGDLGTKHTHFDNRHDIIVAFYPGHTDVATVKRLVAFAVALIQYFVLCNLSGHNPQQWSFQRHQCH